MDNIGIHRFRDLLLGEFSFTDDGQRWERVFKTLTSCEQQQSDSGKLPNVCVLLLQHTEAFGLERPKQISPNWISTTTSLLGRRENTNFFHSLTSSSLCDVGWKKKVEFHLLKFSAFLFSGEISYLRVRISKYQFSGPRELAKNR